MKRLVIAMLMAATTAHAANFNATADTTAALTSPAVNFTILSGSTASSLTVNTGDVTVTIPAGNAFTMTCASRNFAYSGQTSNAVVNVSCSASSVATIEIPATNASAQTLVITPTGTACTPSLGGGGGSSGSGSSVSSAIYAGGGYASVLPAPTAITATVSAPTTLAGAAATQNGIQCEKYLKKNIRRKSKNDPEEVRKLKRFLRDYEGWQNPDNTGDYGPQTAAAVIAFQEKYRTDVLDPWKQAHGNGYVYKTTIRKINELYCARIGKKS